MRAHLIGTAIAFAGLLAGCVTPDYGPDGSPYPDYAAGYPDYGANFGPTPIPNNRRTNPTFDAPSNQGPNSAPPAPLRSAPKPLTTAAYVIAAAAADHYEIDAARIARDQSQNAAVRNFAQAMISDHGMTTRELMAAVMTAGMPRPPAPRPTLRQQARLDDLRRMPAYQFDVRYMTQQLTTHQEAVNLYRAYAERGDVPALREFAARTLPKLQMHLDMAQSILKQPRW
jgi:putative membrane protein